RDVIDQVVIGMDDDGLLAPDPHRDVVGSREFDAAERGNRSVLGRGDARALEHGRRSLAVFVPDDKDDHTPTTDRWWGEVPGARRFHSCPRLTASSFTPGSRSRGTGSRWPFSTWGRVSPSCCCTAFPTRRTSGVGSFLRSSMPDYG